LEQGECARLAEDMAGEAARLEFDRQELELERKELGTAREAERRAAEEEAAEEGRAREALQVHLTQRLIRWFLESRFTQKIVN
jgi:hypothetical protein